MKYAFLFLLIGFSTIQTADPTEGFVLVGEDLNTEDTEKSFVTDSHTREKILGSLTAEEALNALNEEGKRHLFNRLISESDEWLQNWIVSCGQDQQEKVYQILSNLHGHQSSHGLEGRGKSLADSIAGMSDADFKKIVLVVQMRQHQETVEARRRAFARIVAKAAHTANCVTEFFDSL